MQDIALHYQAKRFYLTPSLEKKKFRRRGNKEGTLAAFHQLEEESLGKLLELQGSKWASLVSYALSNVYTECR